MNQPIPDYSTWFAVGASIAEAERLQDMQPTNDLKALFDDLCYRQFDCMATAVRFEAFKDGYNAYNAGTVRRIAGKPWRIESNQ